MEVGSLILDAGNGSWKLIITNINPKLPYLESIRKPLLSSRVILCFLQ
jgi:hypothetical protein